MSAGHRRSQVAAEPQLTEQVPVQVTWQVAPAAQETLPLAPTVTLQVDSPAQLTLHDWPQVPVHSL